MYPQIRIGEASSTDNRTEEEKKEDRLYQKVGSLLSVRLITRKQAFDWLMKGTEPAEFKNDSEC